MSYNIVYDQQFIKTKDERFIPMVLLGDSSLTEGYGEYERMVRSWSSFTGTELMTEQELLDYWKGRMDAHLDYYKDKDYGSGKDNILWGMGFRIQGRKTYNDAPNWIKNSCKKAITFEQLEQAGYSIQFTAYHDYGNQSMVVNGYEPFDIAYSNEEKFLEKLNWAVGNFDRLKGGIYVHAHWGEDFGKQMRKRFFARTKRPKEVKELDHYYTIVIDGYGYLRRHTARGAKYNTISPKLVYETEEQAQKLVDKYNKKYSNNYYVEKVDRPAKILA